MATTPRMRGEGHENQSSVFLSFTAEVAGESSSTPVEALTIRLPDTTAFAVVPLNSMALLNGDPVLPKSVELTDSTRLFNTWGRTQSLTRTATIAPADTAIWFPDTLAPLVPCTSNAGLPQYPDTRLSEMPNVEQSSDRKSVV